MERDTLAIIHNRFEFINILVAGFLIIGSVIIKLFLPLFYMDSFYIYLIVVWAFFSNIFWVLIHEGIHYILFKNKFLNNFFSRVLSIFFGSPFRVLQIGHLLHHSFNRTKEEVTDLYNPNVTNVFIAYLKYYFWIFFGLYFFEFLSNLLFFITKKVILLIQKNSYNSKIRYYFLSMLLRYYKETKFDSFVIIVFYGIVFLLYASKWYLVLAFLLIRGFLISIMDNVYHYGSKENQILFVYNLKMPFLLKLILLNSNLHGFHHKKPNIPWYEAENKFTQYCDSYHGSFFIQFINQFKGPIKNYSL